MGWGDSYPVNVGLCKEPVEEGARVGEPIRRDYVGVSHEAVTPGCHKGHLACALDEVDGPVVNSIQGIHSVNVEVCQCGVAICSLPSTTGSLSELRCIATLMQRVLLQVQRPQLLRRLPLSLCSRRVSLQQRGQC